MEHTLIELNEKLSILIPTFLSVAGVIIVYGMLFLKPRRLAERSTEPDDDAHDDTPMSMWRITDVDQSANGAYKPRLVFDEDGIRIPVDASHPLVHRIYTAYALNPGATLELEADVHTTRLAVTRHGRLRITPDGGEPVMLSEDGTHHVRNVLVYESRKDYLVIVKGGARFPVTGDDALLERLTRLIQANPDADIHMDATLDPVAMTVRDVHGFRAGTRHD